MPVSLSRPNARAVGLIGLFVLAAAAARPSWPQPVLSHPAAPAASYTLTDLGSLPGIELSAALALNAAGKVTGYAVRSDSPTAFVWDRTNGMIDLGVLPGDTASYGTGINAN